MVNKFLLTALILFTTVFAKAQFESVQYDYEKNWFGENQKLPAETSWMLSGALPPNIMMVAVEIYGSSDRSKNPLHIGLWTKSIDGDQPNFYVPVNYKLRSSSTYTIELKYFRKVLPAEKENLKKDVFEAMSAYLELNVVADKNDADLNKNPKAMIKDMNKLLEDGLINFRNDLNIEFPGFSQIVLDQLENMDDLNLKEGKFNILKKEDDQPKQDQKIQYFEKQIENLQKVVQREIDQYLSYNLSVVEFSRVIENYETEKTRTVIPINVGYGAVFNNGGVDQDTDYDSSPFVGISFPLANANFAGKFWSNSSVSAGVFFNNFEFDSGTEYTGPLVGRPFYLAYGYKTAYFLRFNAGATMLENKNGNGAVEVRPFIGVSLEINMWLGLSK